MKKIIEIKDENGEVVFHTEGFTPIEILGLLTVYKKQIELYCLNTNKSKHNE